MLEKDIERRMVAALSRLGCFVRKIESPGNRGMPDRMVIIPPLGRIIFVELKQDKGRLSPLQENTIAAMRKAGADVRVLYGRNNAVSFVYEVCHILKAQAQAEGGDAVHDL